MKKVPRGSSREAYSPNDWFPQGGKHVDILFMVAAILLWGLLLYRAPAASATTMLLAAFLGYEATDLLVGIVHWGLDKYWRYDSRVIGNLVQTFRGHHPEPTEICTHGYLETNSNTYPFVIVIELLSLAFVRSPLGSWFVLSFLVFAANSASIHRMAHLEVRPWPARILHRLHFFVPPQVHIRHHDGHMSHYCAISGHMNWIMDGLGLWRALEWLIKRTTGAVPFHELPAELQRE